MHLSTQLGKQIVNLNKPAWDRRIWEVGYRGPLLCSNRALKPNLPVKKATVVEVQKAIKRSTLLCDGWPIPTWMRRLKALCADVRNYSRPMEAAKDRRKASQDARKREAPHN
uniref:Uncharacterized protein n=1 Tax=Ditylenchus dipsaci TaxID=166011 RepID=A0A915EEZ5_9BILA